MGKGVCTSNQLSSSKITFSTRIVKKPNFKHEFILIMIQYQSEIMANCWREQQDFLTFAGEQHASKQS